MKCHITQPARPKWTWCGKPTAIVECRHDPGAPKEATCKKCVAAEVEWLRRGALCEFEDCGFEVVPGTPYCEGHHQQEAHEAELQAQLRRGAR